MIIYSQYKMEAYKLDFFYIMQFILVAYVGTVFNLHHESEFVSSFFLNWNKNAQSQFFVTEVRSTIVINI